MENEMDTGVIKGLYGDPSTQMISTLGPKVCKCYLHWAIWIPRAIQKSSKRNTSILVTPSNLTLNTPSLGKWSSLSQKQHGQFPWGCPKCHTSLFELMWRARASIPVASCREPRGQLWWCSPVCVFYIWVVVRIMVPFRVP